MPKPPHLFIDISSHGFGHLAITAPVINTLGKLLPELHLTIRSLLPPAKLSQRIQLPFERIASATDFGYVMIDATHIDLPASAVAYRRAHADWPGRVAAESAFLKTLAPDLVLSNVSYLPLAGAARAGIPSLALCSLNWADLFGHFFGHENWAPAIHSEMLAAYNGAKAFLRVTPGMAMPALESLTDIGPIAALGQRHDLGLGSDKAVLVALGGIAHRLPVESWSRLPGIRWLVPADWHCQHPDAIALDSFGLGFTDLLASVDAIVTKPGYGTFTEAACNGTPVLYQLREDWPEQDCLIAWLRDNARCLEVDAAQLQNGEIGGALDALWRQAAPARPDTSGSVQAAKLIAARLSAARPTAGA
nr:hypothetical protein [Dechloromonas sp.]